MDDCTDIFYDDDTDAQCDMGHSESKGAKKRDKSVGNGNGKLSRGVATSFGFRRRPASTSRADDNARRKKAQDKNGNGAGSTEDLRAEEVLSGRSTPLARPRKETAGQPLRSNRFGLRQQPCKTARVGDVGPTAEPAFVTHKESINNNALDKKSTNYPPLSQVTTSGVTTIVGAGGQPKMVTKQTVILTYQTQQYPVQEGRPKQTRFECPRAPSATRSQTPCDKLAGKYTLQTNQLPRPQYPAVKHIDNTKNAKQVVNNNRKAGASVEGWREGASSAVSSDSGVYTGEAEGSPRTRRRPRNLEMVMRGAHSFHLRELQDDLDIMDDAVITGHTVIPLPKLPSTFDEDLSPIYQAPSPPPYTVPSPVVPKPSPVADSSRQSPMSTLERYRTRTRPSRIQTVDYKNEEKFVLDKAQPERLNKQNSFIKSSSGVVSPTTVSSKESSPSCKSEESHFGNSSAWQSHAAGEAMATRSQDDVSIALSVSSCEDDKSKLGDLPKVDDPPKKTIVIDDPPVPHPLLMKSLTLSQHDSLRGTMMGSMTSSNYSTTSTCTNQSADHHLTLTLEDSKFDISALEISTQSLLDDETSPADSLISSTSTSDSVNELVVERDPPSISSAYQTANTKTKSPEPADEDGVDGELLQTANEVVEETRNGEDSKNVSPESPGTPTHASGSLSLSDGRDFFDDEIADQPALLFRSEYLETRNGEDSKKVSPESPGTPTHASGSLSLSDGRDFFDDEIADQPALLFRSEYLETRNGEDSKKVSPESPGTPTHASGSLSLSDGRDFFDDEIADQPALLFRSEYLETRNGEDSKKVSPESPGTPTHASGSLSLSDGRDFFDDEIADQPALLFRSEYLETRNGEDSKKVSPESPGTPTHASGSLSLSDGRDSFDDEIAEQPALLFRKNNEGSPPSKQESENSKQLRRSRERIPASPLAQRNRKVNGLRNGGAERTPSLDTLSSLASDDLMMDNDLARSVTSLQSVDDYIERLDSSLRSGLNSLDERQLRQELSSSKTAVRQWSQLLEQNNFLDRQLAAMAQGKSTTESLTASNTSLSNIGASLPVRTARLLQRSRAQTPSDAASEGTASPAPAPAPASLLQDVVDIKTLLLQLKRVLQEPGDEHHSMSSETLDPLLAACAESPARVNGRRPPASPLHPDACAEMRRQILYLQSQLEERDRLVRVLQAQMLRMSEGHEPRADDTCNVATQTDRLRPPMSSALTSSENSGLVSWNEQASGRKLPVYSEAQKTIKRPVVNGTVKCQCGVRKDEERRADAVQLKTNSRVGSKYLQALANSDSNRYVKRDSSVGEKTVRKSLYSTRSRSIENFHNQAYSSAEPLLLKNAVIEEIKHHTSYGDLYNGRISSKESVNGNRHSPSLNGQSTDTDYSSDGGYKSLPSSINCNGYSPKKISGIPRRSIEQRFLSAKTVKASAV